jgi:hypothetical protein
MKDIGGSRTPGSFESGTHDTHVTKDMFPSGKAELRTLTFDAHGVVESVRSKRIQVFRAFPAQCATRQ